MNYTRSLSPSNSKRYWKDVGCLKLTGKLSSSTRSSPRIPPEFSDASSFSPRTSSAGSDCEDLRSRNSREAPRLRHYKDTPYSTKKSYRHAKLDDSTFEEVEKTSTTRGRYDDDVLPAIKETPRYRSAISDSDTDNESDDDRAYGEVVTFRSSTRRNSLSSSRGFRRSDLITDSMKDLFRDDSVHESTKTRGKHRRARSWQRGSSETAGRSFRDQKEELWARVGNHSSPHSRTTRGGGDVSSSDEEEGFRGFSRSKTFHGDKDSRRDYFARRRRSNSHGNRRDEESSDSEGESTHRMRRSKGGRHRRGSQSLGDMKTVSDTLYYERRTAYDRFDDAR